MAASHPWSTAGSACPGASRRAEAYRNAAWRRSTSSGRPSCSCSALKMTSRISAIDRFSPPGIATRLGARQARKATTVSSEPWGTDSEKQSDQAPTRWGFLHSHWYSRRLSSSSPARPSETRRERPLLGEVLRLRVMHEWLAGCGWLMDPIDEAESPRLASQNWDDRGGRPGAGSRASRPSRAGIAAPRHVLPRHVTSCPAAI